MLDDADLRAATHRLVRTVDGLPDDAWAAPSLLPGWTRAHVVAHLALNAEALAGCVDGALAGESVPMYATAPQRDDDIAELALADPAELRDRLLSSTTTITEAVAQLALVATERPDLLSTEVERSPGGPRFRIADVAGKRLSEVEVHHADLDAGYTSADWTSEFAAAVLDAVTPRPGPVAECVIAPADDPRRWTLGAGGPTVTAPLHALAWWATGRPPGPDVTSDSGALPRTEAW